MRTVAAVRKRHIHNTNRILLYYSDYCGAMELDEKNACGVETIR